MCSGYLVASLDAIVYCRSNDEINNGIESGAGPRRGEPGEVDELRMSETAIEVRDLSKRFGRVSVVDDLSFEVDAGRVTGFLGPNGAGKTTTLRMLLGLMSISAGAATFGGRRYIDIEDPIRHVGAVLEATSFHPARTAHDHLLSVAVASRIPLTRVDDVLGLVGLADVAGRKVGKFSLGMRQRLQLATALLGDPAVLILDEPSNGLDPQGIQWLRALIRGQATIGRTVLVSSHLLSEMEDTIDDVVIVSRGRLVLHDALAHLAQQPGASPGQRSRLEDVFLRLTEGFTAAEPHHHDTSAAPAIVTPGFEP
jgi:ABC-2 type transport system ATP-binding protein